MKRHESCELIGLPAFAPVLHLRRRRVLGFQSLFLRASEKRPDCSWKLNQLEVHHLVAL